ncbi:MAG: hypothetical protein KC416_05435 [Myxococcales bacterium]|nr:hypothetical protein [Myxococcales bacterium]
MATPEPQRQKNTEDTARVSRDKIDEERAAAEGMTKPDRENRDAERPRDERTRRKQGTQNTDQN